MALDVLTIGCICADVMVRPIESFPERGQITLVPHLEIHVGGLAGVTAIVLSQLGGNSAFIGQLGQDGFGDYLVSTLHSEGVDVSRVNRTTQYGTAATVVLISDDGERTFLHHMGTNVIMSEKDVDFDFVSQAKVLHWGGPSITPALDGEPIGRVFKKAHELGIKTSMDTCFDAKNVWFPNIEHALPHLDIVMSSIEEAQHLTGKDTHEEITDFYRSFGVETVMIKMGAEGLFVKNNQESHFVAAHQVPVVDTTGAGDAACGGFLYGYVNGWDLLRCGRLANAVGGLTVQRMGGAEAIHSIEETLAFMESV